MYFFIQFYGLAVNKFRQLAALSNSNQTFFPNYFLILCCHEHHTTWLTLSPNFHAFSSPFRNLEGERRNKKKFCFVFRSGSFCPLKGLKIRKETGNWRRLTNYRFSREWVRCLIGFRADLCGSFAECCLQLSKELSMPEEF